MKGGGVSSSYSLPAKRRWKGLVIAVLGLVFLSMLVPLVFLLGLHGGFHSTTVISGYGTEQRNSAPGVGDNIFMEAGHNINGSSVPADVPKQVQKGSEPLVVRGKTSDNMIGADDIEMMCELKFGTYCLWRREQKAKMDDSVVKRMKDLLFVARAYFPSIAKLSTFGNLSHELKQNIQEFERVLSETTTDKDLPPQTKQKLTVMAATIAKARSCHVDCNNVDKKFRQLVDLTEDEANFHMKQSASLYKLAVQTMPKSLHCLSMRLTIEYFRSSVDSEHTLVKKFVSPDLYHYIIFSRNILASSVVINSSVLHAKESEKQVFHLLTDKENYFAMKLWFFRSNYGNAAVQMRKEGGLSEITTLSAGLLTFQDLVYAIEDSWMLSGLGYKYAMNLEALKTAAVLHFDGSMKPWLELGIPKYKIYWRKYLNLQNQLLSDCNVNP